MLQRGVLPAEYRSYPRCLSAFLVTTLPIQAGLDLERLHSQQKDCCTGFEEVAWSLGLRAQDPVQTDPCKINIHYSPLRPLKDVKNPECFDARYVYLIRVEGGYSFWATGNNVEREIWPLGYGHEVTSDSAVHRFSSSVVAV